MLSLLISVSGERRWLSGVLPQPWVLSVPLGFYRAAMLGWALWLAESLLGWARWAWASFTRDGGWR